jgi:hypothetical protein
MSLRPDGSIDFDAHIKDLESPFWEPIGRYVFKFGMLERKVDEALSLLMGVEFFQHGEFVLSEVGFLASARLLKTYCRGTDAGLHAEMTEAFKEIEEQNTFRNALVHGPWMAYISNFKDGEGAAQKMSATKTGNPKATNITPSEILANAVKVNDLIAKITRISQSVVTLRKKAAP